MKYPVKDMISRSISSHHTVPYYDPASEVVDFTIWIHFYGNNQAVSSDGSRSNKRDRLAIVTYYVRHVIDVRWPPAHIPFVVVVCHGPVVSTPRSIQALPQPASRPITTMPSPQFPPEEGCSGDHTPTIVCAVRGSASRRASRPTSAMRGPDGRLQVRVRYHEQSHGVGNFVKNRV